MNQNLLAEDEDNNTTSSIILLGSLSLTMLKYGAFNVSLNHTFGTLKRTFGTGNKYLKGDCIFVWTKRSFLSEVGWILKRPNKKWMSRFYYERFLFSIYFLSLIGWSEGRKLCDKCSPSSWVQTVCSSSISPTGLHLPHQPPHLADTKVPSLDFLYSCISIPGGKPIACHSVEFFKRKPVWVRSTLKCPLLHAPP